MKQYKVTFWRSNCQLANGGYETERIVEAKCISSARKKSNEIAAKCSYGGMTIVNIEMIK